MLLYRLSYESWVIVTRAPRYFTLSSPFLSPLGPRAPRYFQVLSPHLSPLQVERESGLCRGERGGICGNVIVKDKNECCAAIALVDPGRFGGPWTI